MNDIGLSKLEHLVKGVQRRQSVVDGHVSTVLVAASVPGLLSSGQ